MTRLFQVCALWVAVSLSSASAWADVFSNVPEASGYTLVFSLAVPDSADYSSTGPSYLPGNPSVTTPFSRIAYYMELQTPTGQLQYAYASMDAFTQNSAQIGIPTVNSGAFFQQNVRNLDVVSNVAGVTTGTNLTGGNLEFWPSNYAQYNATRVPNSSSSTFDAGDQPTGGNYGSFQINNHNVAGSQSQTIIAYNRWGGAGGTSDIGLGNQTGGSGNPDWTFAGNASGYSVKNIQILVKPAAVSPLPSTINIMPLGDSITYGAGTSIGGGYRSTLMNNLASAYQPANFVGSATDVPSTAQTLAGQTHHEGHSGYRIDQIANNLTGNDNSGGGNNGGGWLATGNGVNPDYILVLIGTNDFGQGYNVDTAKDRLDALIGSLATLRPNAHIIVSNLLPRTDNATAETEILTLFNPYVPGIVASHAAEGQNVSFVDLYDTLNPVTDLSDGLHPNQQGYDKMADAWSNAIEAIAVPEPASLTLAAMGLTLMLVRRRRIAA